MQRTFEISIGAATELWIQWAWIALDQRDSARLAHEQAGGLPASNPELQAAMVSIVAAASAIDGFARVVRDAGAEPTLSPTAKDPSRATYIWETLRANFKMAKPTQTWPRELKELWKLRSGVDGGLVHPRTIAPEPELPAPSRCTCAEDIHRPKRHALDRGHGGDLHDVHARGSTPRPRRPLSARPGLHHCGLHRRVCSTRCPRRPPPVAARRMAIRPRRASRFAACSTPTTVRRRRREVQARLSADHCSLS